MSHDLDTVQLAERLRAALRAQKSPLGSAELQVLADSGLAHHHFRLSGTGMLARVPKQSQMQLTAMDNLVYQSACFVRMVPSGHTPRIYGTLPPSQYLPRGAFLIEEITGRSTSLPQDLPALAQALAAIHALPVPDGAARAPLLNPSDSMEALLREVRSQAIHLMHPGIAPFSRDRIESELRRASAAGPRQRSPVHRLIAFDAHPGNFLIRGNGDAVLVDLEKGRYGLPALDIAHATLYTSTTWGQTYRVALGPADVARAYLRWETLVGERVSGNREEWLSARRIMWLWSVTWCAKWLQSADKAADSRARGEDWSTELSTGQLVAHVRERVRHYLSPDTVDHVLRGFEELAACLQL